MDLSQENRARGLSYVSRAEVVAARPDRVFAVLEDPALLADLTPAFLAPRLVRGPWLMRAGERIEMEMSYWGFDFEWRLEVVAYARGSEITHRLVAGPLPFFEHRQLVQPAGEGETRLVDLISYRVGYGLAGRLFDRLVLKSDLEHALIHRNQRLRQLLGV